MTRLHLIQAFLALYPLLLPSCAVTAACLLTYATSPDRSDTT